MAKYKSIILSGLPASGKSTLAAMTQEGMPGWERHSVGGLWRARWKEEHPNGEVKFKDYWASQTPEANLEVDKQAWALARAGGVIIDCRYPARYDRESVLLVFVGASLEVRAGRAKQRPEYSQMPLDEILHLLARREDDEVKAGRELFKIDYRDASHYHLVLDTDKMTVHEEFAAVKAVLRSSR